MKSNIQDIFQFRYDGREQHNDFSGFSWYSFDDYVWYSENKLIDLLNQELEEINSKIASDHNVTLYQFSDN